MLYIKPLWMHSLSNSYQCTISPSLTSHSGRQQEHKVSFRLQISNLAHFASPAASQESTYAWRGVLNLNLGEVHYKTDLQHDASTAVLIIGSLTAQWPTEPKLETLLNEVLYLFREHGTKSCNNDPDFTTCDHPNAITGKPLNGFTWRLILGVPLKLLGTL
jgi:hypothetical protein